MSLVNSTNPTLLDMVKRQDPNGSVAQVVEALTSRNSILQDMTFVEGNLATGHRFTSRTGLPSLQWRKFNEGVTPSKSRTDQIDETVGMLEGMSVVDCELAKLNGNEAAFRASEDRGFMQAFNNEIEAGIFYHSTKTAPEKFMGLAPRLDLTTGQGGSQIIKMNASASGNDQTSMYLVCWSPDTVFGIYPKGSVGGLTPHDMGEQLWSDINGKKFRAYVTNWNWKMGLVVKDYRYVVRIANIDTSAIAETGNELIKAMVRATHQMFDLNSGRCAWYCNRTVSTYLHLQAMDTVKNSTLSIENIGGMPVQTMLGIPIRQTDAILNTEAPVV